MKLHEKIRQLRLQRGYSQENLADALGLSTTAYGDLERGKTELTVSRLEQLADAFGTQVSHFFQDRTPEREQLNRLTLENEKLQAEVEKLLLENRYWREKFDERVLLELYRLGQAKVREPIGFKS
jgi:transcriptional regulator with XRE-family HTH domain